MEAFYGRILLKEVSLKWRIYNKLTRVCRYFFSKIKKTIDKTFRTLLNWYLFVDFKLFNNQNMSCFECIWIMEYVLV